MFPPSNWLSTRVTSSMYFSSSYEYYLGPFHIVKYIDSTFLLVVSRFLDIVEAFPGKMQIRHSLATFCSVVALGFLFYRQH